MKYLSICSGIEAATVAWHGLGWQPVGFAEIDPFPSAVLQHHYPDVRNFGDFTTIKESDFDHPVDLIVGGTPCQSFSVAGRRLGLDDPRGNLSLEFVRLCNRLRPTWILWENVPGVFSSAGGEDFATFLSALNDIGYHVAWRVLDAQFFGVPQRRRRVFLVGHIRDWRRAAQVLFEPESMFRDTPKGQKARETTTRSTDGSIRSGCAGIAPTLDTSFATKQGLDNQHIDSGAGLFVTGTLMASGAGMNRPAGCASEADFLVPVCTTHNSPGSVHCVDKTGSLCARDFKGVGSQYVDEGKVIVHCQPRGYSVRRLTPLECERLQGFFPDDYTRIPWRGKTPEQCPDAPRYKAIGNSMAVPVMRWIGERIATVANRCEKGITR